MTTESKCSFSGATHIPAAAAGGTSNRDWWPNQLNLKILHQHSAHSKRVFVLVIISYYFSYGH